MIKGVEASKNKNDTKSMSAAPVLSVRPAAPGVSPVTLPPPLTVIALIAIVLLPVPSCVTFNVNEEVPSVGTFVKSMSVMFSDKVTAPVLPLDKSIREQTDAGKPSVAFEPSGRIAEIYGEIARKAAGKLAAQAKDYSAKFPKIVIDNN